MQFIHTIEYFDQHCSNPGIGLIDNSYKLYDIKMNKKSSNN